MSLRSLSRPRLSLRTIGRHGDLTVPVRPVDLARVITADCEAYRLGRAMAGIAGVLADRYGDRYGFPVWLGPGGLADWATSRAPQAERALGAEYTRLEYRRLLALHAKAGEEDLHRPVRWRLARWEGT